MEHVYDHAHWVRITAKTKEGGLGEIVENISWNQLPFDVRVKWNWYFKYRAALLQVKYPKYIIDFHWGNEPWEKDRNAINRKKEITALKTAITKGNQKIFEARVKLQNYIKGYSDLFIPVEETHFFKNYNGAIARAEKTIKEKSEKLKELENEK